MSGSHSNGPRRFEPTRKWRYHPHLPFFQLMYTQIAETLFQHEPDAFTVKVAKTQDEITAHLQVGFAWIGEKDGLVFLRKRK